MGLYLSVPDGKLKLVFCDVGQGDGALIIKGNWQMLIDTGADNGKMERCLDRYLPFWDKKIEGVMVSHWDKDHCGALEKIIKSYQIGKIFESTISGKKIEGNIPYELLMAGDKLYFGKIAFEILYPIEGGQTGNESSLVLVLNYEGKRFMFTGDVDLNGEGLMMGWWKSTIDGIKISHHGSDTASSEEWLERLKPGVAVVSVGVNSYGHPTQQVLNRLNSLGVRVHRTDKEGDIVLGWN